MLHHRQRGAGAQRQRAVQRRGHVHARGQLWRTRRQQEPQQEQQEQHYQQQHDQQHHQQQRRSPLAHSAAGERVSTMLARPGSGRNLGGMLCHVLRPMITAFI